MPIHDSDTPENARTSHGKPHYNTVRHSGLIAGLASVGWKTRGWKAAILRRVRLAPWCGEDGYDAVEVAAGLQVAGFHPDAFRVSIIRLHPHGPPLLVMDLAEVIVTHRISEAKLRRIVDLWWLFDATPRLHMRLWAVDEFGRMSCVMDGCPLRVEQTHFPKLFEPLAAGDL